MSLAKSRSRWPRAWLPVIALLLVGAGLRLWHTVEVRRSAIAEELLGDEYWYNEWGRAIAGQGGDWDADQVFFASPLYAYVLGAAHALVGASAPDAVRLLQHLLGLGTCLLIFLLARRLFGTRAGLLALALAVGYETFLFYEARLLKSTLSVFLSSLVLWLLLLTAARRHPWLATLTGVVFGLACLVRENYLLFLPVALAWLYVAAPGTGEGAAPAGVAPGAGTWRGLRPTWRRLAPLACLLLGAAAAIAPATVRNAVITGDCVLISSNSGQNLYIGSHPDNSSGTYWGAPFLEAAHLKTEFVGYWQRAEELSGRELRASEVSSFWRARALEHIREQPGRFLGLLGKKLRLFFNAYEIPDNINFYFIAEDSAVLRLPLPSFGVVAPLGLVGLGLLLWRRRRRPESWLLPLFLGCYTASIVLFFVLSRFRLPVAPVLIVFAGALVGPLIDAVRARRWACLGGTLVALLLLFLAINVPLPEYRGLPTASRATYLCEEGIRRHQQGQPAEAMGWYRRALDLDPECPQARLNLGIALLESGQPAAARAELERELRSAPGSAGTWVLLGRAGDALGDHRAALAAYREALAREPGNGNALTNLALTLGALGWDDEALAAHRRAVARAPGYWPAHISLANFLLARGERDAARVTLVAAQAHLPGDPRIADLLARIDRDQNRPVSVPR